MITQRICRIVPLLPVVLVGLRLGAQGLPTPGKTTGNVAVSSTYLTRDRIPSSFLMFSTALGDRLISPGKERVVLAGTLTAGKIATQVVLTSELPGKFRLDETGGPARKITFDGASLQSATTQAPADQDLMESLFADTPETLLYGTSQGAAIRVLGFRFRSDDGKTPNYQGPYTDVIEFSLPVSVRADRAMHTKLYKFDSGTHLLNSVRYFLPTSDPKVKQAVETLITWQTINGQLTPATITRTQDAATVFIFRAVSASVGASASDGLFAHP
jgi:hypothetical protein